jgi:hypothetical protein
MKLTTEQTNAILAGLRLLQARREAGTVPQAVREILNGTDSDGGPLTNKQIDALCEAINFGDFDSPEVDPPHGFEVSRTHPNSENDGDQIVCENGPDCTSPHLWSVYRRVIVGKSSDGPLTEAEWISDHSTEQYARTAAQAYAKQ